MLFRVFMLLPLILRLLDALPLPTHPVKSPLRTWAMFKDTNGKLIPVELYPAASTRLQFAFDPGNVQFQLYTKEQANQPTRIYLNDTVGLHKAGFDPKRKTKFIVHGFLNNFNSESIQSIKNSFYSSNFKDYNIVAVDWSPYTMVYIDVKDKTAAVGKLVGDFLNYLVHQAGVSLADLHCIGHSLGAHVCGFAGKEVAAGKIARISGLDPARPCFNGADAKSRLDATDATFVDCIHTCGGFLGIDAPICDADYYPNAGKDQPGCHWFDFVFLDIFSSHTGRMTRDAFYLQLRLDNFLHENARHIRPVFFTRSCSHGRSHEFYSESILSGHIFPSDSCDSLNFDSKNCVFKGALLGYPAKEKYTGILYTQTNSQYPYAKNWTFSATPMINFSYDLNGK